jgi:hypothetical protein
LFEGDDDEEWCVLIWERAKVDCAHSGMGLGVSPDEVREPNGESGRGKSFPACVEVRNGFRAVPSVDFVALAELQYVGFAIFHVDVVVGDFVAGGRNVHCGCVEEVDT